MYIATWSCKFCFESGKLYCFGTKKAVGIKGKGLIRKTYLDTCWFSTLLEITVVCTEENIPCCRLSARASLNSSGRDSSDKTLRFWIRTRWLGTQNSEARKNAIMMTSHKTMYMKAVYVTILIKKIFFHISYADSVDQMRFGAIFSMNPLSKLLSWFVRETMPSQDN